MQAKAREDELVARRETETHEWRQTKARLEQHLRAAEAERNEAIARHEALRQEYDAERAALARVVAAVECRARGTGSSTWRRRSLRRSSRSAPSDRRARRIREASPGAATDVAAGRVVQSLEEALGAVLSPAIALSVLVGSTDTRVDLAPDQLER